MKNGPHCAFAHGPHDLRPPVYDIRELQGGDEEDRLVSPLVGSLEKERGVLVDDPRWQGKGNMHTCSMVELILVLAYCYSVCKWGFWQNFIHG